MTGTERTGGGLHAWLADALQAVVPAGVDPADLPAGLERLRAVRPERDAAVLVPVIAHPGDPRVLFTRRTEHLDDHPGQVSFPGGRVEPRDAGPVDTALRETGEELGLGREHIRVVGTLRRYRTVSNYLVTPVVGVIPPGMRYAPDPYEVADIFEIPLSRLRDPAYRQRRSRRIEGCEVSYWVYECGAHPVWGATAAMLVELCDRLDAVS